MLQETSNEQKLATFLLSSSSNDSTTSAAAAAAAPPPPTGVAGRTTFGSMAAVDTSTMWATTTDMVLGGSTATTIVPTSSSTSSEIGGEMSSSSKDDILSTTDLTIYGQNSIVASTTSTSSTTTSTSSQYYNSSSYPNYTMYTSANPASYYQQVASIRAQNAAAVAFPYSLTTATPSYYGSYPVDYSAYNQQYYQNISRGNYYNPLNAANYAQTITTSLATSDGSLASSSAAEIAANSSSNGFKEKKVKAKKKKTGSCSPGDEVYARVFIWDMEDISMLSKNCLTQVQQLPHLTTAGFNLQQLIGTIVLSHFNEPNDLQDGDVVNIEDAVVDETIIDGPIDNLRGLDTMRKIAPKYAALRQFYHEISSKIDEGFKTEKSIISYDLLERCGLSGQEAQYCQSAVQHQTLCNQRWQCANRCLELVAKRSAESTEKYANVIICNEGIAYGAAQLLVTGHCSSIPIDNIYSTTKTAKESIFEKIQSRFGKKCSFVSVTSSQETATISKKMSIPVWPISANDDLEKLYSAQRNYLLG